MFRQHLNKAVFALVFVFATTVLASAETSLKSIVDSWFTACRIVIEKRDSVNESGKVETGVFSATLYSTGDVPNVLRVGVATKDSVLKMVQLERDISRGNLAVHPASSKGCPGDLCAESPISKNGPNRDLKILLPGFNSVFDFVLKISTVTNGTKSISVDDLSVFVHYPTPLPERVCAVEEASFWNGLVWYETYWRIVVLAIIAIAFGAIVLGVKGLIKG